MKKKFNTYEIKSLPFELKDIDEDSRKVKIALSSFNTIDSDSDIIRPGAFAKSIAERGPSASSNRKIAHLRHHDWQQQIGKFIELHETETHLVAVSELGRSTMGNDALLDYQDGIIREHSIGFNYITDKMQFVETEEGGYYEITEVKLWEGSAVTFGANQFTPVIDVSKGNKEEVLQKINGSMDALVKALKNPKRTDENLHEIEMQLKVIQQRYNSLVNLQPFEKNTVKEQAEKKAEEQIDTKKQFYINLLK